MTNTADKHTAYTGYDYTVYDAVAPTLAQDMAQWVESGTTVYPSDDKPVFYERRRLEGAKYLMVDTCFFRTMGIEVLRGNPQDLIRPDAAFVSESFARKTFGSDTDPVGKLLELDKRDTLTVCGVYRDMPHNSLLRHDFLASIHRNGGYYNGSGWAWNDMFYAILRLRNTADVTAVNSNLQRACNNTPTPNATAGSTNTASCLCRRNIPTTLIPASGFSSWACWALSSSSYRP